MDTMPRPGGLVGLMRAITVRSKIQKALKAHNLLTVDLGPRLTIFEDYHFCSEPGTALQYLQRNTKILNWCTDSISAGQEFPLKVCSWKDESWSMWSCPHQDYYTFDRMRRAYIVAAETNPGDTKGQEELRSTLQEIFSMVALSVCSTLSN